MQIPKISLWICALAFCGGMTLRAEDTPAQAAARAALTQALQGNPAPAAPAPAPATPVPAAPAAAPAPTPSPAKPTPVPAAPAMAAPPVAVDPVTGDNAAQAQARAALAQKMADMGTPMTQNTVATAPVVTNHVSVVPQRVPMFVPALPISASKEEQLKLLLFRYQTDQISPEQYHQQRAAILAAP